MFLPNKKFKVEIFSEYKEVAFLGDKNATYLCSKIISTLPIKFTHQISQYFLRIEILLIKYIGTFIG